MSDTHDEAEDHALDTFEPAPDALTLTHIPTVVAVGSRSALDPDQRAAKQVVPDCRYGGPNACHP